MTTAILAGSFQHAAHVVEIAEGHHAGKLFARQRQHDGVGTGGDQQAVVRRHHAISRTHQAALAIDLHDGVTGVQLDAAARVPGRPVQHDVVGLGLAGQHG
jgi:hypothetical protein